MNMRAKLLDAGLAKIRAITAAASAAEVGEAYDVVFGEGWVAPNKRKPTKLTHPPVPLSRPSDGRTGTGAIPKKSNTVGSSLAPSDVSAREMRAFREAETRAATEAARVAAAETAAAAASEASSAATPEAPAQRDEQQYALAVYQIVTDPDNPEDTDIGAITEEVFLQCTRKIEVDAYLGTVSDPLQKVEVDAKWRYHKMYFDTNVKCGRILCVSEASQQFWTAQIAASSVTKLKLRAVPRGQELNKAVHVLVPGERSNCADYTEALLFGSINNLNPHLRGQIDFLDAVPTPRGRAINFTIKRQTYIDKVEGINNIVFLLGGEREIIPYRRMKRRAPAGGPSGAAATTTSSAPSGAGDQRPRPSGGSGPPAGKRPRLVGERSTDAAERYGQNPRCLECKTFTGKVGSIMLHYERLHGPGTGTGQWRCPVCPLRPAFATKEDWDKHSLEVHRSARRASQSIDQLGAMVDNLSTGEANPEEM